MKKLISFTISMFVLLIISIVYAITSPVELSMKHHVEILLQGVLIGSEFTFFLWGLITIAATRRVANKYHPSTRRRRNTPTFGD